MLKNILITGAAGFLGSHLCDRFIKDGFYVIGMDNFITSKNKIYMDLTCNTNTFHVHLRIFLVFLIHVL